MQRSSNGPYSFIFLVQNSVSDETWSINILLKQACTSTFDNLRDTVQYNCREHVLLTKFMKLFQCVYIHWLQGLKSWGSLETFITQFPNLIWYQQLLCSSENSRLFRFIPENLGQPELIPKSPILHKSETPRDYRPNAA